MRAVFDTLPGVGTFESKAAMAERIYAIDFAQTLFAEGIQTVERLDTPCQPFRTPGALDAEFRRRMAWKWMVRVMRRRWDDAAAAHTRPTAAERRAAWREEAVRSRKDAKALGQFLLSREAILAAEATPDQGAAFNRTFMRLPKMIDPTQLQQLSDAAHRGEQLRVNLSAALALAEYRAEFERYPERLAELTPGLLPAVPLDRFAGRPLAYRRRKDGYLLYSVGPNGRDVGGRDATAYPPGDDIAVRMPPTLQTY